MPVRAIRPKRYCPTIPRSGETPDDALFRMSNAFIRGEGANTYVENYAGSLNLSETIATSALTGTIALTSGSTTVTGTGTAFTTELHLGQFVLVVDPGDNRSFLLVVKSIASATSFTCCRAPSFSGTVSGETGYRLPVIFALDKDRGTAIRGNVIRLDKGTFLGVGAGTFRINGSAISASLTLTRDPKISLFNSGAGTYTNFTLGMATPAAPTLAAAGGGSPGMQAGSYSMVIAPARTQTLGFNLSSDKADVTLVTGDQIAITVPAMDTTNGQNAWNLYGTLYSDSLGADKNYLNGPWHFVLQNSTVATAGGTFNVEWLDAQIERNPIVDFTVPDDPPPDAEFVAMLNNVPIWISCQGAGSTSPGPWIFPAKPGNIEAAPAGLAFSTSPPEIILGCVTASGRLYLLTTGHLQIAQGTPSEVTPVIIQPYWKTGFDNPYQVVAVNDNLFGFPVSGPTRSAASFISTGTNDVSPDKGFAADVQEIVSTWTSGHVLVAHDPVNDAICFFYSAAELNSSNFWTTKVLVFGLRQNAWIGEVTMSSTTQDMIVSGVATVGGYLEFLCGGRLANNTVSVGTYRFDQPAGAAVNWYAAGAFTDMGSEQRNHVVKSVAATGLFTSANVGVFGAGPTESVPVTALEAGNSGSETGAILLSNSSTVSLTQRVLVNVPDMRVSTVRIEGAYAGSGSNNRVDELLEEFAVSGVRI